MRSLSEIAAIIKDEFVHEQLLGIYPGFISRKFDIVYAGLCDVANNCQKHKLLTDDEYAAFMAAINKEFAHTKYLYDTSGNRVRAKEIYGINELYQYCFLWKPESKAPRIRFLNKLIKQGK